MSEARGSCAKSERESMILSSRSMRGKSSIAMGAGGEGRPTKPPRMRREKMFSSSLSSNSTKSTAFSRFTWTMVPAIFRR